MPFCEAIKVNEKKCKAYARHDSTFCAMHIRQKEKQKSYTSKNEKEANTNKKEQKWPSLMSDKDSDLEEVLENDSDVDSEWKPESDKAVLELISQQIKSLIVMMKDLPIVTMKCAPKKPRTMIPLFNSKRAAIIAKWAFYKHHKNNPVIIAELQPKLLSVGLLFERKHADINGVTVVEPKIPFNFKKAVTDNWFGQLSSKEQDDWKQKALKARTGR